MGAFLSLPGVIITGTLSDYVGREISAVVTYGTSILGVVFALMITSPDQHLLLWLHACFFGLTWGARGPAITAKTADLFPGPNLGAILGVITIGTGLGAAGGSWLAGFVFDTTGSYRVAFTLSIVFYVAGSVAFWALRRPPAIRAYRARHHLQPTGERRMLFLVISEPRPERPSSVTAARQSYWTWIQPLIDNGEVRSVHAKVGRGAVVLFDVAVQRGAARAPERLGRHHPRHFQVHALIDPVNARRFLQRQATRLGIRMATATAAARGHGGLHPRLPPVRRRLCHRSRKGRGNLGAHRPHRKLPRATDQRRRPRRWRSACRPLPSASVPSRWRCRTGPCRPPPPRGCSISAWSASRCACR